MYIYQFIKLIYQNKKFFQGTARTMNCKLFGCKKKTTIQLQFFLDWNLFIVVCIWCNLYRSEIVAVTEVSLQIEIGSSFWLSKKDLSSLTLTALILPSYFGSYFVEEKGVNHFEETEKIGITRTKSEVEHKPGTA